MPAIQRKLRDDSPPHGAVRPMLLLIVGAAGSGRTTFYETHLKTAFPTLLKGSASPLEQTEADQERKRLMKTGESFVYQDVVFDPQLIREAKSVGFEVKAVYVATEYPTLNLGRVLIRVSNGSPLRRSRGFSKTFTVALSPASLSSSVSCPSSVSRRLVNVSMTTSICDSSHSDEVYCPLALDS